MAPLGEITWRPSGHYRFLLTALLLGARCHATTLPSGSPTDPNTIPSMTDLPLPEEEHNTTSNPAKSPEPSIYDYYYKEKKEEHNTTSNPAKSPEPSSYDYYYREKEADFGSDPSTWKLLPIQIPDDLVGNAILQKGIGTTSLSVPSYPTPPTPQYRRHPGTTESQPLYSPENIYHSLGSGQRSPESQQIDWDRHSIESDHGSPQSQPQTWDRHSIEIDHGSPQQQTWDRHSIENDHGSLQPQQQTWDRHSIESDHGSPQSQQQTWERHSIENDHGSPQQQTWDRHSTGSEHGSPQSQHQNWDRHSTESEHGSPESQHQNWDLHSTGSEHGSPESQHQNWDLHSTGSEHGSPESQQQNWDLHSIGGEHRTPESQHQNWDRHSIGSEHGNPAPQQQTWDLHNTGSEHRTPESQHQNWDRHSTATDHLNPEPQQPAWERHSKGSELGTIESQHQNWDRHSTETSHLNPEPQQQTWDRHSTETGHLSPASQQNTQYHHSLDRSTHRSPQPFEHHYHNWTHTSDGYEIRYHNADRISPNAPSSQLPQHPRPPKPSTWTWKPPDAPSWQHNIMARLSQHLPKLPALPKLNLPGFGNLPSFSRLPQWIFGERLDRVQGQGLPQVKGEYEHEFYPLTPENDPLEHLNSDPDRYQHGPHYTYPLRRGHNHRDNILHRLQNTETPTRFPSQHLPVGDNDGGYNTDDTYLPQHLTDTTIYYDTLDEGHQATINDYEQHHEQHSHHAPQYPHYRQPDPRRPFHSHASAHRILEVPLHQGHNEHAEGHHVPSNTNSWRWEGQQDSDTYPPLQDPHNRRQNWISQETSNAGDGHVPFSSTHESHHPPHHHHGAHTYSAQPQRPHDHGSSHGHSQHQQQQGPVTSSYSEYQHQEGLHVGFNPEVYDNILDPLSDLLSRPAPMSIIGESPYQQSIIERLTGTDAAATSSLVIPGGLLVLGLALALFYFNFVWYPTPVVTAKIFKMLSQSVPDGALSEGQQYAVGEVYRVFRGLEAEYTHDPSASSTSCRARLVCLVHHELPGLWRVTQAYATLVRSSLASSPGADSTFSHYQEAARRGSQGEDCATPYPECPLTPAPVKAALGRLLALLTAA